MRLLGIETATARLGVAISDEEGVRASFDLVNAGRHSESLVPAIEFVCRQSGIELRAIEGVAVDIGPGLFTGLRVGLATAKAIAYAHGIPTVPVSSLEVLAHAARLTQRTVVPVIDALSGEVYYRGDEPRLGTPEDLARYVAGLNEEVLLVGDGARKYAETFASMSHVQIADAAMQYPSAAALVGIAARRKELASAADVQIFYLRKPYVHEKG